MDECARMSCSEAAVALLSFAPRHAKAWLYDLVDANPASGIVLCRRHANATVVPMSWQLVDARDPSWEGPTPPVPPLETTVEELLSRHYAAHAVRPAPSVPVAEGTAAQRSADQQRTERSEPTRLAAPVRDDDRAPYDDTLFELPLDTPAVTPRHDFV